MDANAAQNATGNRLQHDSQEAMLTLLRRVICGKVKMPADEFIALVKAVNAR